ncbi:MAG: penicillin-binding protein 2 [Rhodospirillales bacterium]|jgi:penicillin-binding protein 2
MYRDNERYKTFSRRTIILFGGKVVLFSGLIGRMYYLQVIEGEKYKTLSDENRISLKLISPKRGRILDRSGRPMAINQKNYRVMLVPENTKDIEFSLRKLGKIIPINAHDLARVKREIKRRRRFLPIMLRENMAWNDIAQIEVNTPELPGIVVDVGETRFYPDGAKVASVLGYVSGLSEADLTGDPLLEMPGFKIGKAGMERVHDIALRGKSGTTQVEVNAFGRQIRELERQEGEAGAEVWLTLDVELQKFLAQRLGNEAASAVVMDVHTGEVLALASTPSFDPNAFNRGLSRSEWDVLVSNPRSPLNNKAISGQYAPGSTFKMVVALAALEKGIVTPSTKHFCSGDLKLGDSTFHCWKKSGHGSMGMISAITQSCDVYFYEIAKRTGIDRISAMARRLGLGQILNIEIPGERKGLMPTRAWKKKAKRVSWQQGETLLAGIGQGFILATPLQLAVMTSRLVNGGKAVLPHLTRNVVPSTEEPKPPVIPEFLALDIKSSHLDLMKKAMVAVPNSPYGTAYKSRIKEPGFQYGGKTGTVQVRRISKAEREVGVKKNKDLRWEERDHALFVGYAPIEAPRYAVSIVVEHGGGGSSVAAPIAKDILLEVQRRDPSKAKSSGDATIGHPSSSSKLMKIG